MPLSTDFKPRVNGHVYSYVDIQFTISGQLVSGITEINYDTEREKENYYASGSEPIGVTYGERKYTASVGMTKQLCDDLRRSSATGRLEDIPPFDFPVVYINENGTYTKDVLKNFEFKKLTKSFKKGDKGLEVKCECLISGIVTSFG